MTGTILSNWDKFKFGLSPIWTTIAMESHFFNVQVLNQFMTSHMLQKMLTNTTKIETLEIIDGFINDVLESLFKLYFWPLYTFLTILIYFIVYSFS